MMNVDEKADFFIKTVISWRRVKDKAFKLTEREKELMKEAYFSGYEDGKNEYRDKDITS
ncbi:hypothetical protein EJM73_08365 [Clostridium botulinum]|uniref:hypothetical protein n=1 Tax=Clostridium botulinum TaxID=1491 RepID=UPI001375B030|nr:hypothetical protein [Clostridium botulinum]NCI19913.1 hypothetical protein [Clostridium botulinum]NCI35675.1 hypothetical protein [Clostridium botulinum]NCI71808.1 hypothetical protein [Clostridium botulinum]NDI38724.1 hypothetical protein [Clostridium botulinum]